MPGAPLSTKLNTVERHLPDSDQIVVDSLCPCILKQAPTDGCLAPALCVQSEETLYEFSSFWLEEAHLNVRLGARQ